MYVNRYEFVARQATFDGQWQSAEAMARLPRSGDFKLLARAMEWIAEYEGWIMKNLGLSYRARTLVGWQERAPDCEDIIAAWRDLSCKLSSYPYTCRLSSNGRGGNQRHSEHFPYTKNSWPVATNPRGSLGLTCTSQPESSNNLPQSLHWK